MRKLATLQKIAEIRPIEGADNIEVVVVGGWQCVAKKGEFSVGSPCVYLEVDSVLPMESRYEFLKKSSYVKKDWIEGYRLKTVRLRQQLSQGLALPLSLFSTSEVNLECPSGTDLTEILGVKLWDPPVPAKIAGQAKGNFPNFIRKTDQERCISGDTEIITEEGVCTVKELYESKYKGKVLSFNHETGKKEWKQVLAISKSKNINNWKKIVLDSGTQLNITEDHRVFLPQIQAYREVQNIRVDDYVQSL